MDLKTAIAVVRKEYPELTGVELIKCAIALMQVDALYDLSTHIDELSTHVVYIGNKLIDEVEDNG